MRSSAFVLCTVLALAALIPGCGENQQGPATGSTFGPPQNLKALSVNESTIRLQWSAAAGADDSLFAGYIILWANKRDTLAKTTLDYTIDSLGLGQVIVTMYSYKVDGDLSDGATIRWAPAARFDAPYTVSEYDAQQPSRPSGFDVGTRISDPGAIAVSPAAPLTMDLYIYGGAGQISEPLELRSAHMYQGNRNVTYFSTATHSATSLDYLLSAFPPEASFTENTVLVADNTIYYVKVVGANQETNYARLHVRVTGGSFPDRTIEIRVSLQRQPGLLYAHETSSLCRDASTSARRGLLAIAGNICCVTDHRLQPLL
jgi:hypothetical protein